MTQSWNGSWVAERLGIALTDADSVLPLTALVGLALRRNPRRAHLLVSSVLGKHVPTDPRIVYGAGRLLGELVGARLSGARLSGNSADGAAASARATGAALLAAALDGDSQAASRLVSQAPTGLAPQAVVLGFAETATALGHCVAVALGCRYVHSTRRTNTGIEPVAAFAEEHSHAVDHLILARDGEFLAGNGPLVLVDDELSTGRTARNTVRAVHAQWPHSHYVVAALVDLRAEDDQRAMRALAVELGVRIDVVALATGSIGLPVDLVQTAVDLVESLRATTSVQPSSASTSASASSSAAATATAEVEWMPLSWPAAVSAGARFGVTARQTGQLEHAAAEVARGLAERVGPGSVLVLGTEELMYAPLQIATTLAELRPELTVRFSTTTRSPAVAVHDAGYALRTALTFSDPETGADDRFAYNVAGGDWHTVVVVIDEAMATAAFTADDGLLAALTVHAVQVVVVTLPDGPAGAPQSSAITGARRVRASTSLPAVLRGPDFGSYPADDVGWLLTDLSALELEAPTEEREAAIQGGAAHYAESLPIEYQPSAEYQQLFWSALTESAHRIAVAVGIVTEMVLAERGEQAVLASLARAGTPVGLLMRRWAAFAGGLDLPHYAVSIVRGRGIDPVALRYLATHHDPASVAFVDGWTGKGAIVCELGVAIDRFNAASSGGAFSAEVAVLADPGSCVSLFGTRDDFLIPSACLNSTVSGLVSRTVLNDALIGPGQFHGAKFYAALAEADVSVAFVDRIVAQFPSAHAQVAQQWKPHYDADRRPTWAGWAAVEAISARYGIGDVNLVKPGVGETTRVLLRRVPWRILMRPDARAELAHVELLAAQRGVAVEEVPELGYSCVGLIHPRFTRGATGADGRTARR